jgi:pimeloyl-ACP methyl ester carboxylesterase
MTASTARTAALPPIVLVPGYWLGAWVWDAVRDRLTALGHRTTAVTLPGLESADAARTRVTFADHVTAVAEAVRMLPGPVVLVAHSGAGAVATAVADRMPAAFARIVYVDSGPVADGQVPRPDVAAAVADLPVPTFAEFTAMGISDDGLDDAARARFQRLAVPHPAGAVRDTVHLDDPARNRIPTTVICCSIPSSAIRELAGSGPSMFAPLNEIADLTLVDLPTGHWPMLSRAGDLADLVSSEARRA